MVNNLPVSTNGQVAKGSLQDLINRGMDPGEAFLGVDHIVLLDLSGSMAVNLPDGRTCYDAACDELRKIQSLYPGKVYVIGFSNQFMGYTGGIPPFDGGGTNMHDPLESVAKFDDGGYTVWIVSDGCPDNEQATLQAAKKLKSKLKCIYIGEEGDHGHEFMIKLGHSVVSTMVQNIETEFTNLLSS